MLHLQVTIFGLEFFDYYRILDLRVKPEHRRNPESYASFRHIRNQIFNFMKVNAQFVFILMLFPLIEAPR